MSYQNRPPALAGNVNTWAERLNDWLVRNKSKLGYYLAGQSAAEEGVLLWDANNSRLVVSSNGAWVGVSGGGGGITNYLRDDADDSTNFRLTMGGLTVDTDTLYVDSVNNEVGIGTTNPSEKLEVVGNVEATEFIGDLRGAVVFKAQAGEALTKGDVVYISGISGNTTVVSKARADDAAKMPAFGLAAKTVSTNAALEVYTFGTLSGLDTSSFTEGDELFVQAGTAGGLVATAPTGEGAQIQKTGKVTRSHASSGSIKIMGAGRTNATPNLNNGNFFLGNVNNIATTASFSQEVNNQTSGKANKSGDTFTGDVIINDTNNLEVGYQHTNTGDRNIVSGYDNTVSGSNNNVSGQGNTVNSDVSLVTGYDNVTGSTAHRGITAGYNNFNYGENSIIVGNSNSTGSTGHSSIVGGFNNTANGSHCFSVGYQCQVGQATKWFSTALGYQSRSYGNASFAGGRSTYDGSTKYTQVDADAGFAFGTGNHVWANAPSSIALGTLTHCGEIAPAVGVTAAQSMAIGYKSKAYKDNSFAGGNQSYSFGDTSFSFGNGAVASNGFSNIALGRGITTPVSGGTATTIGAVSVGQFNEYAVTTDQHFSVGTGTADGSRYTSMYVGPRSSADSGIVMQAIKDTPSYSTDNAAGLAGVPIGGLYRYFSYVRIRMA
jgi:hypothetical protein